ncbi:sigma-70 family RNA polymerase sigma factor [Actinocatenispora sera]|uniref:sigma-70 family RNA polymerase sigma factor n=1 Tax=Actinocatenispora sera TaxID=390989 RepID=UPI0033E66EB6
MTGADLTDRFAAGRERLRRVAYHLLGSADDADDAVQAAWLKASAADTEVANLDGWLTTITVHECLDQLRARTRRAELPLDDAVPVLASRASWVSPEDDALLADGVDRALLVVLDRLSPVQRVAFVLHDVFALPFEDVGRLLDRSPVAAKKLASRARDRIRAPRPDPPQRTREHLRVVEAFLAAARGGDLAALLRLLAPDVVRTVDANLVGRQVPTEVRGADAVAEESRLFTRRAATGVVLLVDGAAGVVLAPHGRIRAVLRLDLGPDGLIRAVDIVGDPVRLARLTLTVPPR